MRPLLNDHLLKHMRCSSCWRRLVEKAFPVEGGRPGQDEWKVVCPKGCDRGFVSQHWVEQQRAKDSQEAREVAKSYPNLLGSKGLSQEELKRGKDLLYPEG